jgi:hypothetical protein
MREPERYKIVRFFERYDAPQQLIARGLTLAEAQAHCRSPETSSTTARSAEALARTRRHGPWFDSFENDDGPWSRGYLQLVEEAS